MTVSLLQSQIEYAAVDPGKDGVAVYGKRVHRTDRKATIDRGPKPNGV
jgi:hypothetical protein